jgi:MarC family membrane protein
VDLSFVSTIVVLLVVTDPIGNIPLFISALRQVPGPGRWRMIVRESLIAYAVLLLFAFFGDSILKVLGLTFRSLNIAGGVILFLIAIRMVFPARESIFGNATDEEPFIVPIAIPAIAGPGAIATVMLLASRAPERMPEWIAAITLAIAAAMLTLAFSERLGRILGDRVLLALERLMGLLLTAVAVEMLLRGLDDFVKPA